MNPMEEFHFQTLEALKKAASVLNAEELAILCYHCGIRPEEVAAFYEPPRKAA